MSRTGSCRERSNSCPTMLQMIKWIWMTWQLWRSLQHRFKAMLVSTPMVTTWVGPIHVLDLGELETSWRRSFRIEVIQETQLAHSAAGGQVWWHDRGTGDVTVASRSKIQSPGEKKKKNKRGRGQADEERFREQVEIEKIASRQWHNDVTTDRSAWSLKRRYDGPLCFWRTWRCRSRQVNVLVFLQYLVSARSWVVDSLFVKWLSSGKWTRSFLL